MSRLQPMSEIVKSGKTNAPIAYGLMSLEFVPGLC